ncbi:MAG TPA: CRISPR-associated protein Cas5 [Methylomirabilota bacterium]|nr:CRISPR-associated protein Cas5 [Methylomirabilota bacterium]
MEVYSADITAFTSSFRYPMLISGTQLTLEVPPLSTVLGLLNAAAGTYLHYHGDLIGYYFEFSGKAIDIETIYMAEVNKKGKLLATTRSNVVKREFLFDTFLRIYSPEKRLIDYLGSPFYPLLLGRSSDLATVDIKSIRKSTLMAVSNADKIKGQIIPFSQGHLPGAIQPLSKYFTNTCPRELLGKEPYSIISCTADIKSHLVAYRDEIKGKEVDIFFHEVDSRI